MISSRGSKASGGKTLSGNVERSGSSRSTSNCSREMRFSPNTFRSCTVFISRPSTKNGQAPTSPSIFFRQIQTTMRENMVLIMARNDQEWVAGSINYRKGNALFGRYWGCFKDYRFLHFELCYYQTIEYAINRRLALFEAGAQGSHKGSTGLPSGKNLQRPLDRTSCLPKSHFRVPRPGTKRAENRPPGI